VLDVNLVLSKLSKSPSLQELNERVTQLKKLSEQYKTKVEAMAKKKPLETTATGLVVAFIIGIIIGVAIAKR
jgi:hypothetical protein